MSPNALRVVAWVAALSVVAWVLVKSGFLAAALAMEVERLRFMLDHWPFYFLLLVAIACAAADFRKK